MSCGAFGAHRQYRHFQGRELAQETERRAEKLQAKIPEHRRCERCSGRGAIAVGCALTYSIYMPCGLCRGNGRKPRGKKANNGGS